VPDRGGPVWCPPETEVKLTGFAAYLVKVIVPLPSLSAMLKWEGPFRRG